MDILVEITPPFAYGYIIHRGTKYHCTQHYMVYDNGNLIGTWKYSPDCANFIVLFIHNKEEKQHEK